MIYEHMTYANYNGIQSYSDQQQDMFIVSCTRGKRNGTYVEIGASVPTYTNNTFLLESRFEWKGVSVEKDEKLVEGFNRSRINPCIMGDATQIDYDELFTQHNLGRHIDYLQLDTEPASTTLDVLKRMPFDKYVFSIITFEHDSYKSGPAVKIESRNILEYNGYTRVLSDVVDGRVGAFEDWYVNENMIGNDTWKRFASFGAIVPMSYPECSPFMTKMISELTNF